MRTIRALFVLLLSSAFWTPASQAELDHQAATETILFIRHAEKGPAGLGQLSCR